MKKNTIFSSSIIGTNIFRVITISLLFSFWGCSDEEDDLIRTYEEGKPSCIISDNNEKTFYYYLGDRIARIKRENSGYVTNFSYKDNVLTSIYTSTTDKNLMDGASGTTFRREDNKIIIGRSSLPSSHSRVEELELDDNEIPMKITDMGYYEPTADVWTKLTDGTWYALFEFDSETKNLLRIVKYEIPTHIWSSYTNYTYDKSLGAMNKVSMPLWFYTYKMFSIDRDKSWDGNNVLFFNHYKNLLTVEHADRKHQPNVTVDFSYMYNKNKYPIMMGASSHNMFSIAY